MEQQAFLKFVQKYQKLNGQPQLLVAEFDEFTEKLAPALEELKPKPPEKKIEDGTPKKTD